MRAVEILEGKFKCLECDYESHTRQSVTSHWWRSHTEEGKQHKSGGNKGKAWNKGLTKDTDIRVLQNTLGVVDYYKNNDGWFKGKKHKIETINKLKAKCGGVRKGAGRGKGGWYKQIWCDSTYELAWVIYQIDNGKIPKRNTKGFPYTIDGIEHKYYPDFILDGVYYEIKGREVELDKIKYQAFSDQILIILRRETLKEAFEHVNTRYTFQCMTNLYDESKYKSDVKNQSSKDLCECGKFKVKTSKQCKYCNFASKPTKITWPNILELLEMVKADGYTTTGKKLGVTGNSIKKRLIAGGFTLHIRRSSNWQG